MRVSDSLLTQQFLTAFARNRETSQRALEQLSDLKQVRRASDNPTGARTALDLRGRLVRIEGYLRSGNAARFDLSAVETALGRAFDAVTEIRSRAMSGASGTLDNGDLLAAEIDQLRDELVALGNTHQNGRFLFGGTETLQQPFDADGVYQGNAAGSVAGLDRGLTVETTLDGRRAFVDGGDLFATLDTLSTALRSDDLATVQSTIADLNAELEQINLVRAEVGSRLELIDNTTVRLEDDRFRLEQRVGEIEGVDLERITVELALANNSNEALAAAASRILGRSLFDIIR